MSLWVLGFLAFVVVKIKGSFFLKSVKSIESECGGWFFGCLFDCFFPSSAA